MTFYEPYGWSCGKLEKNLLKSNRKIVNNTKYIILFIVHFPQIHTKLSVIACSFVEHMNENSTLMNKLRSPTNKWKVFFFVWRNTLSYHTDVIRIKPPISHYYFQTMMKNKWWLKSQAWCTQIHTQAHS